MYFKGLIDMECFQSNLEKMEKLCNSNNCEAELDFKLILTNNDYIPCAENLSRDSTNLGCSKVSGMVHKFQYAEFLFSDYINRFLPPPFAVCL
jgi:hypothetical protein